MMMTNQHSLTRGQVVAEPIYTVGGGGPPEPPSQRGKRTSLLIYPLDFIITDFFSRCADHKEGCKRKYIKQLKESGRGWPCWCP